MIHGWAANAAVFNTLRGRLPESWRILAPDLPGHGAAAACADGFSVASAADGIAAGWDGAAHVLGWSLGGLVALQLAHRYPEKVKSLILCSSFARLHAAPDYAEGVQSSVLDKMADWFGRDYAKFMRQFLELQLLHHPQRGAIIDAVLPDMLRHGTPAALAAALRAVREADLRGVLPEIACPVLLVYGNKDAVTPPRLGGYLARHLPNARLHMVDKAAHAPFLSHGGAFAALLTDFVQAA